MYYFAELDKFYVHQSFSSKDKTARSSKQHYKNKTKQKFLMNLCSCKVGLQSLSKIKKVIVKLLPEAYKISHFKF